MRSIKKAASAAITSLATLLAVCGVGCGDEPAGNSNSGADVPAVIDGAHEKDSGYDSGHTGYDAGFDSGLYDAGKDAGTDGGDAGDGGIETCIKKYQIPKEDIFEMKAPEFIDKFKNLECYSNINAFLSNLPDASIFFQAKYDDSIPSNYHITSGKLLVWSGESGCEFDCGDTKTVDGEFQKVYSK